MLLIDEVVCEVKEGLIVKVQLDPQAWYASRDGYVPAWIGIELMAQTISAWAGLQAWRAGLPPRKGFLVGAREYKSTTSAFSVEDVLLIEVRNKYSDHQGLAVFDCTIRKDVEILAQADIKVINLNSYQDALPSTRK
jgi:predicted hotdog family 3-hydroxylacyl-ACP dehydratase